MIDTLIRFFSNIARLIRFHFLPLILLSTVSLVQSSVAETFTLNSIIETVTPDVGDTLSSCGLGVGQSAKLSLEYDPSVDSDFFDGQFATFFNAIENYSFEFGSQPVAGEESVFASNTIGVSDAASETDIQIVNFSARAPTGRVELDVSVFHQLPEDLLASADDLSSVKNMLDNSNLPMSVELWFECDIPGSEGATFVTFQSVPEPAGGDFVRIGSVAILPFVWLRRRKR